MKDRHQTLDTNQSNYAGIDTWDSIHIVLTYASCNELEFTAGDVQNTYLQALSLEKHFILYIDDCGIEYRGKVALIKRALYKGKMVGYDCLVHIHSFMKEIDFMSFQRDSDV